MGRVRRLGRIISRFMFADTRHRTMSDMAMLAAEVPDAQLHHLWLYSLRRRPFLQLFGRWTGVFLKPGRQGSHSRSQALWRLRMGQVYLRVQSAPVFVKTRVGTLGTNRPSAA